MTQRGRVLFRDCAILALWLLVAIGGHIGLQSKLDDDRALFYANSFAISAPAAYDKLNADWQERIDHAGFAPETPARFAFRYTYAKNYTGQLAVIASLREVFPFASSGLTYPEWMRSIVVGSGLLITALGVALLMGAFATLPSDRRKGALLGVAALGALSFLPGDNLYQAASTIDWGYPLRVFKLLIQPGPELSLFGIQHRNVATVALAAAVLFRWRGAATLAYACVAFAAVMHATYGVLCLLILVGLDAVLTPQNLRHWRVALLVVLTAAWGGLFGVNFGAYASPLLGPALLVAVVGGVWAAGFLPLDRLPPVGWLRSVTSPVAELLLVSVAIVGLAAMLALVAPLTHGLARIYVVDEMSARPFGLLRVPLFLAAGAVVMQTARVSRPLLIGFSALAIVFAPLAIALARLQIAPTPSEAKILSYAPGADARGQAAGGNEERVFYYAISKAIDLPEVAP